MGQIQLDVVEQRLIMIYQNCCQIEPLVELNCSKCVVIIIEI